MSRLLCIGASPALQRTLVFPGWMSGGDVVRANGAEESVGGKATNAARAIRRVGGEVTLLSLTGGPRGQRMQAELKREGLEGLWVETRTETRICQTLLDGDGRRIRELVEEAGPVQASEWRRFKEVAYHAMVLHDACLVCGSLPRKAPTGLLADLAEHAHEAGCQVILDARGDALSRALPHQPLLVKINREECLDTTGQTGISGGIDALLSAGCRNVLITDGPGDAWLGTPQRRVRFSLPKVIAVNPIGGGDTVTGIMAWHLMEGKEAVEAARSALAAGLAQALTPKPADFDPAVAAQLRSRIQASE